MVPELGHFALILALCFALFQCVIPLVGAQLNNVVWMRSAKPLVLGQFLFLLIAFACLEVALITNDFSVSYVAHHSNSLLPLQYRISALWGGHEGSLLLWVFLLSAWSLAVSIFSQRLPAPLLARVLGVMGLVSIGFLLFMLETSNPFERYLPNVPVDGKDLNPLLQDFGLIVHPPMLYMGYVGFSVAFAFAIAALLSGQLDATWARWSRPWTTVAWVFLTGGIALGSWWAYYELGWGGWWFWDPVENASFMPWLVGTALIHSLAVAEKRNTFKSWTLLLAIMAFSLSLLGTFLVRSGVLTSVHAFATDPERGIFILQFLTLVIGGSLALYAWRASKISSSGQFEWLSRETFLLLNNLVLAVAAAMILLGTLYPLILDALGLGKISVGPPYFNALFIPLVLALALMLGFGISSNWKRMALRPLLLKSVPVFIAAGIMAVMLLSAFSPKVLWQSLLGVGLAIWVMLATLHDARSKLRTSSTTLKGMRKLSRSYWGMCLGHFGFSMVIIGATLVSLYNIESDVRMSPGERHTLDGYAIEFVSVENAIGPNYRAAVGRFDIHQKGRHMGSLYPEKRFYWVTQNTMTEAGIDSDIFRDIYVSLGEPVGDGSWAVRIYYKPFVVWLWLGALVMMLGGVLAIMDRRYRIKIVSGKQSDTNDYPNLLSQTLSTQGEGA